MSVDPDQHDTLFAALSNSRRRTIIRELAISDDEHSIGSLAEHVARMENGVPRGQPVDSADRKRVYIGLHQMHLGKLDDWDVIDWDQQADVITPGPEHERALRVLEVAGETQREASILQRVRGAVGGDA